MGAFAVALPAAIFGLLYYGLIVFCIWKFYQLLSSINESLRGIRRALEREDRNGR